ncbi:hypothetical protein OCU04_002478 [Sclerotinia nivalis]|uniref:Uncharacterized protein n=1 Tax=Sclerotinia nivalis TaxID=352851 RepID=A0A9X0ATP1_9HELO|nr:hypothetical protein OCU04_002478 [Sclerotinia nivalis]
MLPTVSLQAFPTQQSNTTSSSIAPGSQTVPETPPSPSSAQSQAQVQFQVPVGHQNAQSQQSAAFSNQGNQAGHFTRNNHNTLFSQFSSISLLKIFVKHLTTWDKGTIIAVVTIIVSTIISYFALKLAIWTATKDYIEYCQGEEPIQEASVQCRKAAAQGLPPPPFYQYTGTVLRRTWTGIIIGATESKTQNDYYIWGYALIASAMFNVAWTFRPSKRLESLRASGLHGQNDMEQQLQQLDGHITDPNVAWTSKSSKPLKSSFLRDSDLLVPIDMEQQPQQLGSHTTDPWPMNLTGEDRFSAVPEGNLTFRSGAASGTNQDKAPPRKLRQRRKKRFDRLRERQMDLVPSEQRRSGRLVLPIGQQEQDARTEQLGPENSVLPENEQ